VTKRPLVDKAWARVNAEFEAASSADPLIGEGLAHARAAEDSIARNLHIAFAASRLAPLAPSLPEDDWRVILRDKLAGSVPRIGGVPAIPGRVVWAIRDEADAEALRGVVVSGQVWVRADLVTSDHWPTVQAHAMDAMERTIGKVRPPGRRKGSTNRARDALLAEIRSRPDMTPAEVDRRAVELGSADPAVDEVEMTERAKRLRRAAKGIKP
jgi:hypothetical protein